MCCLRATALCVLFAAIWGDAGDTATQVQPDTNNPAVPRNMNWFARVVAYHPYVILTAVAVFAGTCLVIPLATKNIPNFSDPQLGFEARGTTIAQRLTTWENLIKATGPHGQLTVNPKENLGFYDGATRVKMSYYSREGVSRPKKPRKSHYKKKQKEETNKSSRIDLWMRRTFKNRSQPYNDDRSKWTQLKKMKPPGKDHWSHDHSHLSRDGFFCGSPSIDYSRVVFIAIGSTDLFTFDSILDMCHLEHKLTRGKEFEDLCQTVSHSNCCQSWSLGNYIALLRHRASCFNITREDVRAVRSLLKECAPFYHNLKLTPDCLKGGNILCQQVPAKCSEHSAVYNIMYYLMDVSFLPPNASVNKLSSAMLILPIASSSATLDYYHTLDLKSLRYGNVEVAAMQFGLKNTLFDEYLVKDTWMLGAGGTFVLFCMWLYTGSLFVTFMTVVAIIFSLGISYFMYTLVFELHFFPFMNLLGTIVAVGIGADDAFIFCKVWQCAKAEKNNGTLVKLVHDTLKHAILSMFVTSLTTAAALYASYISSITAIGCFSVFAGTATLANFALMVTWLPACVVVSERWCCPSMVSLKWFNWDAKLRPIRAAAEKAHVLLDRLLVMSVVKLHYFWLFLLGSVVITSIVIVFHYPRLKLPDSRDFQLFNSGHPFERYDLVFKDKFWFERLQKADINTKLPLRFVWGVLPVDDGDYLDPSSRGTLKFDPTFDMAAPESQAWLLHFCRGLRAQSFYQSTLGPLLPNCFIESFMSWMQRRCADPAGVVTRAPCCETARFPYQRALFETCILQAIANLYETPVEFFMPGVAGPKFSKGANSKIQAVVVEYDSKYSYSMSFTEMHTFYHHVEKWMQNQLAQAPPGMHNGWFISDLEFYDLQLTLSENTLVAIGISMGIALLVLILVTLNLLISLYAIFTITCIIFVTVAVLVLLGWKLNVLESIAITVAIGLAVDFSLHYGVHYCISPEGGGRQNAVSFAVSRMGGPTAMAALTTVAAGAFMLPSSVLAYIQIGIFLVVVMLVSWIYSTFFLGSILCVVGPQHGFGQFSYPRLNNCCGSTRGRSNVVTENREQTVYTNVLSESTLSTSSIVCPMQPSASESHELEALTARQNRRWSLRHSGSSSATMPTSSTVPFVPHVACKVPLPEDQSPLAASVTTIVLTDDAEATLQLREEPLLKQ